MKKECQLNDKHHEYEQCTASRHSMDGCERGVANPAMFFRRWLANPLQMGSVFLRRRRCANGSCSIPGARADEAVLELGAGTGVISRALLAGGVPPERLIVVEIVPEMADHLRGVLPWRSGARGRREAPARPAARPLAWQDRQRGLRHPAGAAAAGRAAAVHRRDRGSRPGRGFLHYSYCVTSPLPWRKHALTARREAWTPLNFPPASVWRYVPGA